MAVHYFHCTDGVDLIVDRDGLEADAGPALRGRARAVAAEIMRALPDYDAWQTWAVHVYDARGQVEIVPFEPDTSEPSPIRQKIMPLNAGSTDLPHSVSNRRRRRSAWVSPVPTIASSGSRKRLSSRPASSR